VIQPELFCLVDSFIVLEPVAGQALRLTSISKKSASYASAVLLLFDQSRYVLLLLDLRFYCCCTAYRALPVPTLKNRYKSI
jgi:hypothetical protein